ncbi:MAG TPA: amino acid permease [Candidatus Binatia bacterium]|nr:amino acid permease [Candidatus Binatia bacterium]
MDLFRTKPIQQDVAADTGMRRDLNAFDLTMLGIGAIIGAGIFVLTGISAATQSGPAIVLSFVVAGVGCACAALAYAELAASIGGCGSAYGYGYAGFGEFPGWVIGWMLIAEYAIAVSAVSVGWSGYFNTALESVGMGLPHSLLHGPFDATPGIVNLPAVGIVLALVVLLASGAKISARANEVMVFIKLAAVALFIGVALFHVNAANWHPFIPPVEATPAVAGGGFDWNMKLIELLTAGAGGGTHFGVAGIFGGAAIIFFAYLGFDAVSTSAEETANPQRDLPIGIIGSLVICTVLYIVVSGLLTGIVSYHELNVPSPVAYALLKIGQNWAAGMISLGAIAGLTTVCLVMYYGLTRLLYAIARDGLLPRSLATLSPKSRSPVRIILFSGAVMVFMSGFVSLGNLASLTNFATLAAFIVVCVGTILLRRKRPDLPRPFKTPGYPFVPILGTVVCGYLMLNLSVTTWLAFVAWMSIGLVIYFGYSYSHSVLAVREK